MVTLYGIKNCDTMKKAMKWLSENGIDYDFHDFKKVGLEQPLLARWIKTVGWETLVNRRGTTWRKLPDSERDSICESSALRLMLDNPSLIKRPVLSVDGNVHVGFNADMYSKIFS